MWYDYIRIQGYAGTLSDDVDPGVFEVFQGLGGGAGTEATPTGLDAEVMQNWFDAVTSWQEKFEQWLDDAETHAESTQTEASNRDLLPALRDPPPIPNIINYVPMAMMVASGPAPMIAYVATQIGTRLIEAHLQRKTETIPLNEIRDVLKDALLYDDGAQSILKKALLYDANGVQSILDKALLYLDDAGAKQAFLDDIKTLLENLEATEDVLEIGKNAIWTKSRVAHH